ncbi:probable kinetochore protein nuf2 isoform X1 [Mycetomoellerius zeteki]|uniref:probable kinetochore protein nuf2 isoform X1 n=1 Tax=Mycetomoellerius zeteki TaxID=64791 RepID=UPI00084E9F9A|nr:PREDICTED: probable kinetochore protein nuf2 isoform X1 [Trachymyrmex zeteki]XP_018317532.1 PREDICTED: probable kinetochore protein nuf2 isoform X1 [Trachymyrmex zeteki]XP_018317533.1 PREDICTED: probable kinetochore protein nuf2 isoform X1 [Trachymyrmex zeteki]XP_018317534.1 PREDICTED: probable kinetochore protein nuf2 isoform X1 [Trachymyrmex zeteki]
MDVSIAKIHHTLLDAALPSTIKDLKNPTEDYVVNLLTTFLTRFGINMSLIDQPIPEQLGAMMYYEDSDVINLINLYVVVAQISNKIFLHDFCLTDITSPGQKRLRKQAKFLSNFVLYTMHKQSGYNDRMDEIQTISKLLEDLKERKTHVSESINNKVMHKAKQLSMIEKLENDIEHMQSITEKLNKQEMEFEIRKNNVDKENQKAKELCGSVKTTAGKLSKMITEIQSEVVHSPKEYRSRLDEIEKQHKLKEEERSTMQEAIQEKKQSIKLIGEKLNFVQKTSDDFRMLADTYKEQKNKKTKRNNVIKEIDSLNNIWSESKTKLAMHKDKIDIEKNELQTYNEEDMVLLCNLYSQLLSDKKIQKTKLDKAQDCLNEKCLEKNKLQTDIKKIEEETRTFINSCQESYDNELANEFELRRAWKE